MRTSKLRSLNLSSLRGSQVGRAIIMPGLALSLVLVSAFAGAGDAKVEAEAKKLQTDAMDVDFLSLDLAKARGKLQSALKKCAKDKCGNKLVAELTRDLGVILVHEGDGSAGEKEFATALATDSSIIMPKDYIGDAAVAKAWEAAKKKGAAPAPTPTPTPTTTTKPGPTPGPDDADGALIVKLKAAVVGNELPIVVEIPKGLDVKMVKVTYRSESMEKYKAVEAKKEAGKWFVVLPCAATKEKGEVRFFVKALDESSAEVEHYGTIKKPGIIRLVDKLAEGDELPLLPGDKEPKSCRDGAAVDDKKPEGSGCKEDDECEGGLACTEGDAGKKCSAGERKTPASTSPKLWIGIEGGFGFSFVGAEKGICKSTDWACSADTASGRRDVGVTSDQGINIVRHDDPTQPLAANTDKTDGGSALTPIHVGVAVDYFVAPKIAIGGKVAFAFGGNPTTTSPFLPIHAEVRGAYFFMDGMFRPYVGMSAGFAQLNAKVPNVIVYPSKPEDAEADGKLRGVTAYRLNGPFFVAPALGAWIMPSPKFAVTVAIKIVAPLPVFALGIAPEFGFRLGF